MKLFNLRFLLLISILFFSGMAASGQKKRPVKKVARVGVENGLYKNGIKLVSKGLKVSEAYLVFDNDSLVSEGNKVELNQHVNMVLIIDSGWTVTDGRVFPGSKQVIKLSNGRLVLNTEDLFAAFDETGVSAEDARYITLNAIITDLKDKKNHVIINFRVWDKRGTPEITGSYKLFIK